MLNLERIDPWVRFIENGVNFEFRGLLTKRVGLDYSVIHQQPWALFDCTNDKKYSFRIHELQFGLEEGNKEAAYWLTAQKKARLEGHAGLFYPRFGLLRGYLSVPEDCHKIGVQVKSGSVAMLRTQKQLNEDIFALGDALCNTILILSFEEYQAQAKAQACTRRASSANLNRR
jgi:hypothetical protein